MNAEIGSDFFNAVRKKVDLVKLVSHFVDPRPAGKLTVKGCCPFHKEKTSSFYVNTERKITAFSLVINAGCAVALNPAYVLLEDY